MRISDWSSDVCSSDLVGEVPGQGRASGGGRGLGQPAEGYAAVEGDAGGHRTLVDHHAVGVVGGDLGGSDAGGAGAKRSEEHTSELQSLMRISLFRLSH